MPAIFTTCGLEAVTKSSTALQSVKQEPSEAARWSRWPRCW